MNISDKRELLVTKALSREKKNQYSQDISKRTLIESGWGDCSGTLWYWYYKLFDLDIGANTQAQINSDKGIRLKLNIQNGIPDESVMEKGDLLFFRGSDNSRTEGVGHVEMYIGNGKIFGHGSGIGGTVKDMKSYCRSRFNTPSTSLLKNKGLICVKRFLGDDIMNNITELTSVNDIVWEYAHRGIITDSELWLQKLQNDSDAYWLARKALHFIRQTES